MKRRINIVLACFINLIVVLAMFLLVAWIKPATRHYVIPVYWRPMLLFASFWVVASALGGKYKIHSKNSFRKIISILFFNDFFMMAIVSVFVVAAKIELSRMIIIGTTVATFVVEFLIYGIYWFISGKKNAFEAVEIEEADDFSEEIDVHTTEGLKKLKQEKAPKITYELIEIIVFDLIIFVFSFFFVAWFKNAMQRMVIPMYWKPMVLAAVIWVFFSFFSEKYYLREKKKFSSVLSIILVTNLIIISIIAILVFAFKAFHFSRLIVFGTTVVTTVLEIILAWAYFFTTVFYRENPDYAKTSLISDSDELEESAEIVYEKSHVSRWEPVRYNPGFASDDKLDESVLIKMLNKYLNDYPNLFEFINDIVALENFHKSLCRVLNTTTLYNIEVEDDNSLELLLNLHKVNDMRRLNKYFIQVNKKLKAGAVFIGIGKTNVERRRIIRSRFPRIIAIPLVLADFILNRIFPKIYFLQGIYFAITKGKNRALSKCEILGRLTFCGFEIIDEKEIGNSLVYIVKKVTEPSRDTNPSYGPLFRMRRRGKHGKNIYVYKFRTMHPYSEYLQHYMVERYGYGEKGKIEDDFRVTDWGKIIRKLWLDELPQILNWLKGDLALVGVRPLSDRFLKEYPEELREERFKYKPGCIPPYVALKMQRVEDYLISEKIYLEDKRSHPILTDIKYFFWAIYNILTNRIRSE